MSINKKTLSLTRIIFSCFIVLAIFSCNSEPTQELPNILWLTSEDNSPFLGCYGDTFATTPNLDKLATEGFLYTHAYANAPVCAPARNTIITGVYACSNGNQHMRSYYDKSEEVKTYPEFLKELGYYCTNNYKTDYNTTSIDKNKIWDQCDKDAHYKNRKPGQPFFAIFNSKITHESSIHTSIPTSELRHDPKKVPMPPYHPRTEEMEHDWAQYYDKVEDLDTWIGEKLQELEDEGLADNTIVFYYADHGGILGRSKRFVYESGTHVPFIIRIPEKYKHLYPASKPGEKVGRLVSFVDLVPTLLSILGVEIPGFMQGKAFLGKQKTEDPEYAYMFKGRMDERYDMSRAVRDKKYRYVRNYMPYRIYGQHLRYLWLAPSMPSWEQAYLDGKCNETQSIFWNTKPAEELYDTENDPWEVNNLAGNPDYEDVLERMRAENEDWMLRIYDTGFIPESDRSVRAGEMAIYDYMRSGNVPLKEIIEAADCASLNNTGRPEQFVELLKNEDSAIRYWGATGLLIMGEKARPAIPYLEKATAGPYPNVAIVAAETLYKLGKKETAIKTLLRILGSSDAMARCHALNVIDCNDIEDSRLKGKVSEMVVGFNIKTTRQQDIRSAFWLMKKWGITVAPEKKKLYKTKVSIEGEKFYINGKPTFNGRKWQGNLVEGLLPNSRMVQGIFDDYNPLTAEKWKYPDTKKWDANRNTDEFVGAMASWYYRGLRAFTLNMQGGSPMGYGNKEWKNPGFNPDGSLISEYMGRLEKILDKADKLGMVVILGYFYFGQDQFLEDEKAVVNATQNMTNWILDKGYENVLVEVANEANLHKKYDHEIISVERIHELIEMVKNINKDGRRLLASTSFGGKYIPTEASVGASDFVLLHGNDVDSPAMITSMVDSVRKLKTYRPMPIVFNEDDHYGFDLPENNFVAATKAYASWGFFDFRQEGEPFENGFQSVPVSWEIDSERKKDFFKKVEDIFIY